MVRDRRQTLSGIDAETMRPRVRFHGSGNRHEQKQKREEKIGNRENGNGKAEIRSQSSSSRSAVQQAIIDCSDYIKMVQKARKIKVFRAFAISKRADMV